jgi:hypothetical protein
MPVLLRRFLVLAVLLFWLGGFTFYSSVVVFVGQAQLGHRAQGFITREVTVYLNLAAAAALPVLAWDLAALGQRSRQRALLWTCWAGMLATLGLLIPLHMVLGDMMVWESHSLTDPRLFRTLHRVYLWVNTVQWGCGVLYALGTLAAWRNADRAGEGGSETGEPRTADAGSAVPEAARKKNPAVDSFGVAQSPK